MALLSCRPDQNERIFYQVWSNQTQRSKIHWPLLLDPNAKPLAERLTGLPLALATAGTYLQHSTIDCERYLKEYEKRWNISRRRPLQLQEYQERTLYTTWDLSYSRLEKEDPDAAELLKLLANFDNQKLWFELFHAGLTDSSPEWLHEVIAYDVNFNDVIAVLVRY